MQTGFHEATMCAFTSPSGHCGNMPGVICKSRMEESLCFHCGQKNLPTKKPDELQATRMYVSRPLK